MIKADYSKKEDHIVQIEVSGHADYDKSGKDIVCSAVSTAVYVTANAIEMLGLNHLISLNIKDGYFKLTVKEKNETINKLLLNLEYTLKDLEEQYPKYIKNQKEG